MLKERYKHMNEQIQPSDELLAHILSKAQESERQKGDRMPAFFRPAIIIVSVALCFFLTLPVLAAKVDTIYQLMYFLSPNTAQFFVPVQKSDEKNEIKMEVISAYIRGNVAEIYISMQDLTGGRIDETTDLSDSYSINRPFSSSATCRFIGYEESTKTATFMILIEQWEKEDIGGRKITFMVQELLSQKQIYDDEKILIDLSAVPQVTNTRKEYSTGGSGGEEVEKYMDDEYHFTALSPGDPMDEFPIPGIDMTGIGYIDGSLHIQVEIKNLLENDNHGYFYLKGPNGEEVICDANFYFRNEYEEPAERIDYIEYIFDIPMEEIGEYSLYGYFVVGGIRTEGNWRVTFPLETK